MTQPALRTSAMSRETAESAGAVRRLLVHRAAIAKIAQALDVSHAPLAVVCGRGSSGHAGIYLRYLIETRLSLPVSATAPSVTTALHRPLKLEGALFIAISQSGASPDLVAATQAARDGGAQIVAIVNEPDSAVAQAAHHVLPMLAGEEHSVAATKSVVASMVAGAMLVAAIAGDTELTAALERLPDRLDAAHDLDWTREMARLSGAPCAFVVGRGLGLGSAREIALKLAETLRLPALGYSAAELLHGPRAAISTTTPVLALRLNDNTASTVDALVGDLRADGIAVAICGGPEGDLPWIGDDMPATDAIAMLIPAYRVIEQAARAKDFDPDRPPRLSKITRTL
ncbi:MAG: SIS domain-containing protein [Stellaceae bacterium]